MCLQRTRRVLARAHGEAERRCSSHACIRLTPPRGALKAQAWCFHVTHFFLKVQHRAACCVSFKKSTPCVCVLSTLTLCSERVHAPPYSAAELLELGRQPDIYGGVLSVCELRMSTILIGRWTFLNGFLTKMLRRKQV